MSKFFCDTNCELWFEEFDTLGINLIQMPYTIDGEERPYDLGRNTDITKFFDAMRKGAKVKTQALNQYDYTEYFEPIFKAGEDIIYVSFSHRMSATFEAMNAALAELRVKYPDRKLTIVNTKNISMGAGILVKLAAELHNAGASDSEVAEYVEKMRKRTKVYFTVDDLVYLRRGGRLTTFKSIVGTMLNLKPIIEMTDEGVLESTEKVKGRKMALNKLLSNIEKSGLDTSYPIRILHADSANDAEILKEIILEKYPDAEIRPQLIGPVIGCHCGPDTVGIAYIAQEK